MGTDSEIWDVLHKPDSLQRGLGCDEANPRGVQFSRLGTFGADIFVLAPRPIVPTRIVRATSPAVAARRSVVELAAIEGELRIRLISHASAEVAFFNGTAIQANSALVTGGTSLLPPSPQNQPLSAQVRIGDRAGDLVADTIVQALGTGTRDDVLPPIPPGWTVSICTTADNTALTVDFIFEERAGRLGRVEGA